MYLRPPMLPKRHLFLVYVFTLIAPAASTRAEDTEATDEVQRRNTAVALNYCRASLHRIRKYPTQQVLHEEQQKILNNLNLDGIADPEVIRLYTEVLDEISQVPIAEREHEMYNSKYNQAIRRSLAFDALALSLEVASQQYLSAVRRGAGSWWDYRNTSWNRENELLKLEKSRVNSVTQKSSTFLDTFWKLARKRGIPDRWLVRGVDLDKLEIAMREPDPEVRLRILKRMEPFMEYYPPYWYYVGRTQQSLGDLSVASVTYLRLADVGEGFFRYDDMLATGMANRAAIQHYMNDPAAVASARRALAYSTDAWQANLMAAKVLKDHGAVADAEDAILRNLDTDLEKQQSITSLAKLYHDSDNLTKLAKLFDDDEALQLIPVSVSLPSMIKLASHDRTGVAMQRLTRTIYIRPELQFGADNLVLVAAPIWRLDNAKLTLTYAGGMHQGQFQRTGNQPTTACLFKNVDDIGSPFSHPSSDLPIYVTINYEGLDPIVLAMNASGETIMQPTGEKEKQTKHHVYTIAGVQVGEWKYADGEVKATPITTSAAPVPDHISSAEVDNVVLPFPR